MTTTWKEYARNLEAAIGELLAELREADRLTRASVDALRTRIELLERDVWAREEAATNGDDGS